MVTAPRYLKGRRTAVGSASEKVHPEETPTSVATGFTITKKWVQLTRLVITPDCEQMPACAGFFIGGVMGKVPCTDMLGWGALGTDQSGTSLCSCT